MLIMVSTSSMVTAQNKISLAGEWKVRLDPFEIGISSNWQEDIHKMWPIDSVYVDTILLPGSLPEHGYGNPPSVHTDWNSTVYYHFLYTDKYAPYRIEENFKFPFWLTSDTYYKGVAWYQREVEIPDHWENKRVVLELERPHWGTMVFVDDQMVGADSSLAIPHRYDITKELSSGKHTITVRVDNRMLHDVGKNAHSVTEHTQGNWNGLAGELSLTATSPVYISDIQIYPDIENKQAKANIHVENSTGMMQSGDIRLQAHSVNTEEQQVLNELNQTFTVKDSSYIEIVYPMGENPLLWDEFNPQFYSMEVNIEVGDSFHDVKTVDFGMREFKAEGKYFTINGRPVFLRGTLESAVFPKTGYPPTAKKDWADNFKVMKRYGINHIRFHSWTPPRAAFEAADEAGIYLNVEGPFWVGSVGCGEPIDQFVNEETERIMREYGNHPSFVMFAHGNEATGCNIDKFFGDYVSYWKKKDNRRMYTSGTGWEGWPKLSVNDFHSDKVRIQKRIAAETNIISANPPSTDWDFTKDVQRYDIPVVGHETGQWTVYPNFDEMSKYTGVLYPHNFEVWQDFLEKNQMSHQAYDFLMASGKLQVLSYKADIEASLRTPDYAGYQLLQLNDFPGQGTALVGVLDPFWDSKPYIDSAEFSRFNSPTVPLARMEKRILSSAETFVANLEIAHFESEQKQDVPILWRITNQNNHTIASGETSRDLPIGNNIEAGTVRLNLADFDNPQKLNLNVKVGQLGENDWDFWVYPEEVDIKPSSELIITKTLTPSIERQLEEGAKVLLQLNDKIKEGKGKEVHAAFSTVFWNTAWTTNGRPHTMGVLVDPSRSLFKDFPTEYHSNWQWWDILYDVQPMILTDFPKSLTPSIQMIHTWSRAKKLGLLFEAKVGKGKLIVTSIDFENDLNNRLATRQLYHSLLQYMESSDFAPYVAVDPVLIRDLYN